MELRENKLDVTTYLQLRQSVGWKELTKEQARKALEHSIHVVVAYDQDQPVGMGRLVGDGAVICYVQDLIVVPEYQGKKVGSLVLNRLKEVVQELQLDDTTMMFALMCAKGREDFYKKHEFIARPNDQLGPGMIQYLVK